jgi:hypothetical protein
MLCWQWSIIVGVLAQVNRDEEFPWNFSDSIDHFAGFEESFSDERLDHSLPFACEIYGPRSSLRPDTRS